MKEVAGLLKKCTATVFKLNIECAAGNAADAAINYGQCCAFTYPALGFLHSVMKFKESGEEVNVSCKYDNNQSSFSFETVLAVKISHVVAALLRIVFAEAKRMGKNETLNTQIIKEKTTEK